MDVMECCIISHFGGGGGGHCLGQILCNVDLLEALELVEDPAQIVH